ncbi:MAG TPA: glutathione S-transferase family protein [Rhizomicrobium sp.]|jgi:glutathione S-transferase|nr:glutathione S-transferase family protein [Rhizomicrobium sp.]
MILVGQYDSPYTRRVAISLMVLGFAYEHDTRSVFGDFDSLRRTNPAGRIPALVLDDGETLIDSAAILDWLDETVGPDRALLPPKGAPRRNALKRIALANAAVDKIGGGVNYETMIRPSRYRWPEWIARCTTQGQGALTALDAEPWPEDAALDQAQITTGCAFDYIRVTAPHLAPAGRYPALDALLARLRTRPEFAATSFTDYAVPRAE